MSICNLKKRALRSLVVLTIYVLIWSAIFMFIEQTDEPNTVVGDRILRQVKNNITGLLGYNISEEHFDALVKKISEAVKITQTPDWTYWQTIDFVMQSLTTIGFGAITPRTRTGQMVFILFAVMGLPLTMVTLKITGELLLDLIKSCIVLFERRFLHKQETKNLCVKAFIVSFVQFIFVLLFSACLFARVSRITFLEGIYASFVMLSTIGFGDYIFDFKSAQRQNHISDAYMTALLVLNFPLFLLNLTAVSCFLNAVILLMESVHGRKFSCIRDGTTQEQDNPVAVCSTADQEISIKPRISSAFTIR